MFPKEHQNGINASASVPQNLGKAHSFFGSLDALCHKAFRPQNPLAETLFAPFFPDPSQTGLASLALLGFNRGGVPPSGGSLEIGNVRAIEDRDFDGVPPSGGSLEIGNENHIPFSPARMESTRTV